MKLVLYPGLPVFNMGRPGMKPNEAKLPVVLLKAMMILFVGSNYLCGQGVW